MFSQNFNEYKKKITGFGEVEKTNGLKINGNIKLDSKLYENNNNVTLVLMYENVNTHDLTLKRKNNNFPFLCNL